eukprot:gene58704-80393_t
MMTPGKRSYVRRNRPDQAGLLVGVRLQPDELDALDSWRAAQPAGMSRPEAMRALVALALGEAEAFHLGISVQRIKALAILLVALAVGASVASAGMIGFVGIVVPHLLRLVIGPDHHLLLPFSALAGGGLLLAADIFARSLAAPAEVPIGIITAAIGA